VLLLLGLFTSTVIEEGRESGLRKGEKHSVGVLASPEVHEKKIEATFARKGGEVRRLRHLCSIG